jgi:hypothetical protein
MFYQQNTIPVKKLSARTSPVNAVSSPKLLGILSSMQLLKLNGIELNDIELN